MLRLIPNSLFMRLFLLMAITLTISHFLGMELMSSIRNYTHSDGPPGEPDSHNKEIEQGPFEQDLGGMEKNVDERAHRPPPNFEDEFHAHDEGPGSHHHAGGPPLPPIKFILVELLSRLAGLLLVSWVGARWLSAPIKRMADAANAFGKNLDAPALDESGTVEVQQAAHALNQMREKLRRQINERSTFLAAISHDLRTPLTRMQLRAESVEPEKLQNKFRSDIAEMSSMLTAAIEYLRGHTELEDAQLVDITSMVQSIAEDAMEQGDAVSLTGAAMPIRVKPLAIKRCLNNLIQNALTYGGCAQITLTDSEKELAIEIKDKGPGIDPQRLDDVFLPFHRLESSRNRATGGVGLGLTIARDIAVSHGGELILQNAKPSGLIATLRFPRDMLK